MDDASQCGFTYPRDLHRCANECMHFVCRCSNTMRTVYSSRTDSKHMVQQHRLPNVFSQLGVSSHCGMLCVRSCTLVCRVHMSGVFDHLQGDWWRNLVRNVEWCADALALLFVKCICQVKETVDGIKFATTVHAHMPYADLLLCSPCPWWPMLCCIKRSEGEVRRNT